MGSGVTSRADALLADALHRVWGFSDFRPLQREAMHAIIDANVTHVISAGIMAYFGSGPVRGFAIVLLIGVVTSVFTAVYFTRMLVALWIRRTRPRAINI